MTLLFDPKGSVNLSASVQADRRPQSHARSNPLVSLTFPVVFHSVRRWNGGCIKACRRGAHVPALRSLVNLRVLNAAGQGRVSWVLAALDWMMTSGSRYKIRVVNMSLGMPAVDSYTVDRSAAPPRRRRST